MAKTAEQIIEGIDFPALKQQKLKLLNMIEDWESSPEVPKQEAAKEVMGIIHMIDDIQDHAVDVLGKDEKDVFNLEEDS